MNHEWASFENHKKRYERFLLPTSPPETPTMSDSTSKTTLVQGKSYFYESAPQPWINLRQGYLGNTINNQEKIAFPDSNTLNQHGYLNSTQLPSYKQYMMISSKAFGNQQSHWVQGIYTNEAEKCKDEQSLHVVVQHPTSLQESANLASFSHPFLNNFQNKQLQIGKCLKPQTWTSNSNPIMEAPLITKRQQIQEHILDFHSRNHSPILPEPSRNTLIYPQDWQNPFQNSPSDFTPKESKTTTLEKSTLTIARINESSKLKATMKRSSRKKKIPKTRDHPDGNETQISNSCYTINEIQQDVSRLEFIEKLKEHEIFRKIAKKTVEKLPQKVKTAAHSLKKSAIKSKNSVVSLNQEPFISHKESAYGFANPEYGSDFHLKSRFEEENLFYGIERNFVTKRVKNALSNGVPNVQNEEIPYALKCQFENLV